MDKPQISYPCRWQYTVVGEDESALRQMLLLACAPREVAISFSRRASGGRYVSLKVEVLVTSEEERIAIFRLIQNNEKVRFIL